ncbi:hypothetical protein CEH05_04965 [Halobacillus halophilus]|uniref:HPr kinase/phosphorylase C-terminal domain-containing protein n=1 Tax=Halobacillus halophilus (strain ATCC 35676 / DSM 2266 / JCM 20832 / KCTC 3685 / LMG 17431 / NBRC 102448 / NCIMB 2269) TaxID=866895 RepID=I0JJN0_HALH3|nr:hypothetical protein [Halobacillus halophilus]ASF38503.1 hypothetical protein CEH05_04965 [Halobacillus halophilus]CCG44349.1 hypothetical protein HBHAL_1988 [Halobacillus halophilus DSM 2266]
MDKLMLAIGDHFIEVTGDYSRSTLLSYDSFFKNGDQKVDLILTLKEGYGDPFRDYEVTITSTEDNIIFRRADYLIQIDVEYRKAELFYYDGLALKHALMNLYSAFIVHHNWGVLLHSSSVIEGSKAHIFSGQSGAGKSTVAKMSQPRDLLSDEATIIKITDDEVKVYPSPFWSELRASHVGEATLSSIQLLYQAKINRKQPLKKSQALVQLIDKVFYWSYSPAQTTQLMTLLKQVVEQVPIHELYFKKDPSFWELIS